MKAAKRPPILKTSVAVLLVLLASSALPAKATTTIWTGAVDNTWDNAGNWTNGTPFADAPADLIFTGSKNTNTVNNNGQFVQSITFDAHASTFTITDANPAANFIAMNGGSVIVNNSPNLQSISAAGTANFGGISLFDLGGSTHTWTAASGDMLITSTVSFNAPVTLILNGAHNITITGQIFDAGAPPNMSSLVVDGPGKVWLMGQNTYPGNTIVNGGTLIVDGSIASQQTYVNGGTLGGSGVIGGNVYNASGNVQAGDGPGHTLTVGGNYIQSPNGTLTAGISSKAGQTDVLAVQQQAQLSGNLRLVSVSGAPRLKVGDKVTILTAREGVQGHFSNVTDDLNTGTIVTGRVVYHATSVEVDGAQGSFGKFAAAQGLTPNERAVANGLDKIEFRNRVPKLLAYLDDQPLAKLPSDFDRISPDQLSSIFNIGVSLANVQTSNLERRTDDIRSGSHGFSASGFAAAGSGPLYSGNLGVAGPSGDDGKESKEMKTVAPVEDRWGVFITGVGEWVNVSGDNNSRGYDITTGGFTVGADYKVTPNFAVGVSAGYAGTASDLNNGGRVYVNGGKLGLYSTYFTGGFYVDTAVSGGYNSYDTRRDALQGTARGDTDGGELNVLVNTGYDVKVGGFTFGPTASFQYTYLGIGSFDESGSLSPLSLPSQHQDSLRTAIGFKANYDWKVGGVVIKPEVRAAWQHEFGDDSYAIESSFQDNPGSLFTVNGPRIGRDSLLLGAGFAVLWNERTSTYLYYDGELARQNYESNAVSGGVRVSF
jgi:outer membrane autotransporter protein